MQVRVTPAADLDGIHKGGSSPANDGRTCIKGVMKWCSENLWKVQAGILKPHGNGL